MKLLEPLHAKIMIHALFIYVITWWITFYAFLSRGIGILLNYNHYYIDRDLYNYCQILRNPPHTIYHIDIICLNFHDERPYPPRIDLDIPLYPIDVVQDLKIESIGLALSLPCWLPQNSKILSLSLIHIWSDIFTEGLLVMLLRASMMMSV